MERFQTLDQSRRAHKTMKKNGIIQLVRLQIAYR